MNSLLRQCRLSRRPGTGLFTLVLLFSLAVECRALTLYSVSINTTAWSGQSGSLAFDLTGGDSSVTNNTAAVSSLATNGTLGNASDFSLTDTGFFNEVLRGVTFGTSLSFTLSLTENRTAPGLDQFSFFVLDVGGLPLGGTTDPTGADALFAIDITGQAGGNAFVFNADAPGVSWQVTQPRANGVPDGGSTLSLALISVLGFLAVRFRRGGQHCAALSR